MMQIIVKSEAYTYMYDSTVYDSESEEGQYFPSVEEAVEAALRLLCNSFPAEKDKMAAHDFVLFVLPLSKSTPIRLTLIYSRGFYNSFFLRVPPLL